MNVEYWWPQPVWYDTLQGLDFEKMANKCLQMEKESPGRKYSNVGGWQSGDVNLWEIEEFKDLFNSILNKGAEVCRDLGNNFDLRMDNSWININRGDDYNVFHVHPFSNISGCVYLKSNDNSGSIEFLRGDAGKHYLSGINVPWNHIFSQANIQYKPEVGKIVMFPSWLEHRVTPSTDNETRISIAFNFRAI